MTDPIDDLTNAAAAFARAILAARSPAEPERNLSVTEAAKLIGVSRQTLYNRMNAGEIQSIKIGRRRLIPPGEVRRLSPR